MCSFIFEKNLSNFLKLLLTAAFGKGVEFVLYFPLGEGLLKEAFGCIMGCVGSSIFGGPIRLKYTQYLSVGYI